MPYPPIAKRIPIHVTRHGDTRVDAYAWLRSRDDPTVRAYLEAENTYTDAALAHLAPLRERLEREFRTRTPETDRSAPVRHDEFWYYHRTIRGLQYPIFCRRAARSGSREEVILDQNDVARGHGFCRLGAFAVSPDHRFLAYAIDLEGSESYTIRVRDLQRGRVLVDDIAGTVGGVAWASGSRAFSYCTFDTAHRPHEVWWHRLGTRQTRDRSILRERDRQFELDVTRTRSGRFLFISSISRETSEWWAIPADDLTRRPISIAGRRRGHRYEPMHHGDSFYLRTNDRAPDFRLVRVPIGATSRPRWQSVVPHRSGVVLERVDAFAGHLVLTELREGIRQFRILPIAGGRAHVLRFPESAYAASLRDEENPVFATSVVRIRYSSPVTPTTTYAFDLVRRRLRALKRLRVRDFDPRRFVVRRISPRARDGVRIPLTIVHRRGLRRTGAHPCLLTAYGAYQTVYDPGFVPEDVSLLARGVILAIAHVRGGGERGKRWYDAGRLLRKRTTFTDTIACAEALVRWRYTTPERLAIHGGSAGGLLVGAVVNARPDLFAAAIAEVPFVDVVNTMLDRSLPLTVQEYEEWGDPRNARYYRYVKSYAPYEHVRAQRYPALLVTAGFHDTRVAYWEPAKWVARLRAIAETDRPILLKTEFASGHAGASGRYDAYRELAFLDAFLIDAIGARGMARARV